MKPCKCIIDELHLPRMPFWLVAVVLIALSLAALPFSFIYRGRVSVSTKPPIHIFQDMDVQPRYDPQASSAVFADGRAMRTDVPGSVARGELVDDHYNLGYQTDGNGKPLTEPMLDEQGKPIVDDAGQIKTTSKYYQGYPSQFDPTSMVLMRRGQERYNISCYPCHGKAAYGDGPINARALELVDYTPPQAQWVSASNLHAFNRETKQLTYGEDEYPNGKLFNVISNGIRNMPAYSSQIDVQDRWAIVLYVRALQASQHATLDDVPADKQHLIR